MDPTPEPSDEEEESEEEEDDGFGSSKKKGEDQDPAASKTLFWVEVWRPTKLNAVQIYDPIGP